MLVIVEVVVFKTLTCNHVDNRYRILLNVSALQGLQNKVRQKFSSHFIKKGIKHS